MQEIGASAVAAGADGVLTARPGYVGILAWLCTAYESRQVYVLWREVFGEEPLACWERSEWDVMMEFLQRVDRELFPVDLQMMNEFYYSLDEEPMNVPVPVSGLRMPWEVLGVEDLPAWQGVAGRLMQENFVSAMADDMGMMPEPAEDLLEITWPGEGEEVVEEALGRLRAEGEPWDGLAELLRLSLEPMTGNPFLDWPDEAQWICEYAYNEFYWTAEDIRYLAEQWAAVKEVGARIANFREWYHVQPDYEAADEMIVARLRAARQDGAPGWR